MTLLLHDRARQALDHFAEHPGHAMLLVAPPGAGKATAAKYLAARVLDIPPDKLSNHPYYKLIQPVSGKSIAISEIRDAIHFLALHTTGTGNITRVVVIEDAGALTVQAQNAFLKTLEEPPEDTLLILTASNERALLATIRSRVQILNLAQPSAEETKAYFIGKGHTASEVDKTLLMSGGLPGLMTTLLDKDSNHPLYAATAIARDILQKNAFDRIVLADELAKNRQLWADTLFILSQMAGMSLVQGRGGQEARHRWYKVMSAVYAATEQTERNGQLKLILLNFMMTL